MGKSKYSGNKFGNHMSNIEKKEFLSSGSTKVKDETLQYEGHRFTFISYARILSTWRNPKASAFIYLNIVARKGDAVLHDMNTYM